MKRRCGASGTTTSTSLSTLTRALATLALLALAACTRDMPTAAPPPTETRLDEMTALPEEAQSIVERRHANRFTLTLKASGALRPGEPIALDISLGAKFRTPSAEVQVLLPDFALSKIATARVRAPVGPQPAHARWTTSLGRGAETRFSTVVTFPKPGIYQVIVRAEAGAETPDNEGGIPLQNLAQQSVWLYVAESGGRVSRSYDRAELRSLVGNRYQVAPGPLMLLIPEECDPTYQFCEGEPPPPQLTVTGTVYWLRAGAWTPLPFALVRVPGGPSTVADAWGNFNLPYCPSPGMYVTLEAATDHADVMVARPAGNSAWQPTIGEAQIRDVNCNGHIPIYTYDAVQAELFDSMLENIRQSRALFANSANRGKITVRLLDATEVGRYNSSGDYIEISRDWAVGSVGIESGAHEYGHAVHHKALGGLPPIREACPSPHFLWTVQPLECAAREGFADFHAAMTRGPAIGSVYGEIANNIYIGSIHNNYSTEGSKQEGAIAAFLFDMVDGVGWDWAGTGMYPFYDRVAGNGRYIADIIRQCQTGSLYSTFAGGIYTYRRAEAIDHWFYCMDRFLGPKTITTKEGYVYQDALDPSNWWVDPWLRDNWFAPRRARGEKPARWRPFINAVANATDQRELMFANLYTKFTGPYYAP